MINAYGINILEYVLRFPDDLQFLVKVQKEKPLIKAIVYQMEISNYISDIKEPRMVFKDLEGNEYETLAFMDPYSKIGSLVHVPLVFTNYKGSIFSRTPIGYKVDNTITKLSKVNENIVDEYITSKEYQNCMEVTSNCYLLFKNGIQDFKYHYGNVYSEFENRILKTKLENINNIQDNNYKDGIIIRRYY